MAEARRLCGEAGFALLDAFLRAADQIATHNGRPLTSRELQDLADRFRTQSGRLTPVLQHHAEELFRLWERWWWSRARTRPLERLVVQRFAHLLMERDDPRPPPPDRLSRRVVPGFLFVLQRMVGVDTLGQCRSDAEHLLNRLRQERGERFDWDQVYQEPEARRIVETVLMAMVRNFEPLDHRLEWLAGVMNDHLAPPDPDAADALWQVTPRHVALITRALFAELAAEIQAGGRRVELEARFGAESVAQVEHLLAELERWDSQRSSSDGS